MDGNQGGGWRIGRSIGLELDFALFWVRQAPHKLPKITADLRARLPEGWLEELNAILGHETRWFYPNEYLARWAGVLISDDYDSATLAMRESTAEDAVAVVAAATGLEPDDSLEPVEQLIDLEQRSDEELLGSSGLQLSPDGSLAKLNSEVVQTAVRALKGGDLHGRYWHWLDRFYYEAYRPWRIEREDEMQTQDALAEQHLGGRSGSEAPSLDWVSATSPVRLFPGVRSLVEAGETTVVFWVEPLGLCDAWTLTPELLLVTFGEPGPNYDQFDEYSGDMARSLKALADPTRLKLARIIRNFELDNTQLATYLNVSRPTVSVHARTLRDAGLISTRWEGRKARHTLNPEAVQKLFKQLRSLLDLPPDANGQGQEEGPSLSRTAEPSVRL